MKSILAESEDIDKAETFTVQHYNFSARLSTLQGLSEELSKVDFSQPRPKDFKTILNPSASLQKRYKTILDSPNFDQIIERSTQTSNPTQAKIKTPASKTPRSKNFLKANKNDLKVTSAPVSAKQSSLKSTPRVEKNTKKHIQILDPNTTSKKKQENTEHDPDLLSIIYKQFSDLVLMQWEEAADMLIDELLEDEIEYLNTFEGCNTEVRPRDVGEIIEELEKIEEFKMGMRGKYLKK